MTGIEVFIATLCIQGFPGCGQASTVYLDSSAEFSMLKDNLQNRADIYASHHEYVKPITAIVGLFASDGLNFNLLNANVVIKKQTTELKWSYSWK